MQGRRYKYNPLTIEDMKYGAQPEYEKQRKGFMHRPDEGVKVVSAGNKNDYIYRDHICWKVFQEKNGVYIDALKAEGVDVVMLNDLLDERHQQIASVLSNLIYTRDVVIATNLGAHILRD